jgi:hypothetical protein
MDSVKYINTFHKRYHEDPEYANIVKARGKLLEKKNIYNHYKRLVEDQEYFMEKFNKGLRLRNVPEEFELIIRDRIKVLQNEKLYL